MLRRGLREEGAKAARINPSSQRSFNIQYNAALALEKKALWQHMNGHTHHNFLSVSLDFPRCNSLHTPLWFFLAVVYMACPSSISLLHILYPPRFPFSFLYLTDLVKEVPKSKSQQEAERVRLEAEQIAKEQAERDAVEAALEAERAKHFDLKTCSAQDYLARTIYPTLAVLLQQIDAIRPEDPIQYLGVMLHKEAQTSKKRIEQLNQLHQIREQLREQYTKEYNVAGRV